MKQVSATFVKSSAKLSELPEHRLPEYAFAGRSNVGKSSLINMLLQKKDLAKTSGKPGKTRLFNHFFVDHQWYLVDLPGYGFAKVSKTERKRWANLQNAYLLNRKNLVCVFLLIDCRHPAQQIDLEFMEFMGSGGVPFAIIFTKADKLKPKVLEENLSEYKRTMLESWDELPDMMVTSSEKGMGRDELMNYIRSLNESLAEQ